MTAPAGDGEEGGPCKEVGGDLRVHASVLLGSSMGVMRFLGQSVCWFGFGPSNKKQLDGDEMLNIGKKAILVFIFNSILSDLLNLVQLVIE
jgi:hypothetical protein